MQQRALSPIHLPYHFCLTGRQFQTKSILELSYKRSLNDPIEQIAVGRWRRLQHSEHGGQRSKLLWACTSESLILEEALPHPIQHDAHMLSLGNRESTARRYGRSPAVAWIPPKVAVKARVCWPSTSKFCAYSKGQIHASLCLSVASQTKYQETPHQACKDAATRRRPLSSEITNTRRTARPRAHRSAWF